MNSPVADARLAQQLRTRLGHQYRLLEVADKAVLLDRALDAEHHAGLQHGLVIGHEPGRIPAEPDAVAQAREIALGREAEISELLEAGARYRAGGVARADRSDAGLDAGDRGVEGFLLRRGRLADRLRAGMIEVVAAIDARQADLEPLTLLERLRRGPGWEVAIDHARLVASPARAHEIVVENGAFPGQVL